MHTAKLGAGFHICSQDLSSRSTSWLHFYLLMLETALKSLFIHKLVLSQLCICLKYWNSDISMPFDRQHIQEYLEMILTRIQGLLVINTSNVAFEQKSGDRSCLNNNTSASHLSVEDQQFMFETASVLIIQSSFTPEVILTLIIILIIYINYYFIY